MNYIKTPLSEESLNLLLSSNNIDYDKTQLFSDFVQSLLTIVFDTYLGDEVTITTKDKIKHFNWCWEHNINKFKLEGIYFEDTDESFNYFIEFIMETFYTNNSKYDDKGLTITIRAIWLTVFLYSKLKTRHDVDNFIQVYKILDDSLKKGVKKHIKA